jgi:carboxylate-amine ligase
MKFLSSPPLTVGIELEVQLVDRNTGKLTRKADAIFENVNSPLIHREFLKSMVEFVSPVCEHPHEAVEQIQTISEKCCEVGKEEGFSIAASGTHPFAQPEEVKVTENERYLRLLSEFQEVLRNFLIYGLHVHIGFPDEKSATNAYNAFVKYAPLFLALSASSPFFRGRNTGILSYRSKIFEQLPRAGIPQQFRSYLEFTELIEILKNTKTIESLKDIWWDVRLRPDLGTVEIRICDSVSNFERLKGIANLMVMVGRLFMEETVKPTYHQINLQNRWNAARHGLNGNFIDEGANKKVGTVLLELVAQHSKKFGKLKEGAKILEKLTSVPTVAEEELRIYERTRDFKKVVAHLCFGGNE